jgi:hypothetical protein
LGRTSLCDEGQARHSDDSEAGAAVAPA